MTSIETLDPILIKDSRRHISPILNPINPERARINQFFRRIFTGKIKPVLRKLNIVNRMRANPRRIKFTLMDPILLPALSKERTPIVQQIAVNNAKNSPV